MSLPSGWFGYLCSTCWAGQVRRGGEGRGEGFLCLNSLKRQGFMTETCLPNAVTLNDALSDAARGIQMLQASHLY